MSRSFQMDYEDENLFNDNTAGNYTYYTNSIGGKSACGQLEISKHPEKFFLKIYAEIFYIRQFFISKRI